MNTKSISAATLIAKLNAHSREYCNLPVWHPSVELLCRGRWDRHAQEFLDLATTRLGDVDVIAIDVCQSSPRVIVVGGNDRDRRWVKEMIEGILAGKDEPATWAPDYEAAVAAGATC